jgi:hypothetical protein
MSFLGIPTSKDEWNDRLPGDDAADNIISGGWNEVGDWVDDELLQPGRDAKNETQAELDAQKEQSDAMGEESLRLWEEALADADKYDPDSATLSESDIASLDKTQNEQEARTKAIMAQFGLSDSTMTAGMLNDIGSERVIAEGQLLNENKKFIFEQQKAAYEIANSYFQSAITLLGLSNSLVMQSAEIDAAYYQSLNDSWTALVGATATVAGAYFGGPAGAAAGTGLSSALKGKTEDIGYTSNGLTTGTPNSF